MADLEIEGQSPLTIEALSYTPPAIQLLAQASPGVEVLAIPKPVVEIGVGTPIAPPPPIADQTAEADSPIEIGQPIYLKPNGHADLASAAAIATARVAGLAVAAASPAATVRYTPSQFIELDNWSSVSDAATLTPGMTYYLAPEVGKITAIAPTEVGQTVIAIGTALSPYTLSVEIQSPILL